MTMLVPTDEDMLLIVDVQNDFCPGGGLAIAEGDLVVPVVNRLARLFPHAVLTQDWHTPGHSSFASSHPGRKPFETIELNYGPQTLWPDHCVMGTMGAAFHRDLDVPNAEMIVRKGFRREIDSYSAFMENDRSTPTGLDGYLKERGIRRVVCAGLALDYCVRFSAEDGRKAGFEIVVVLDACRAVGLDGSAAAALQSFRDFGVDVLRSDEIAG